MRDEKELKKWVELQSSPDFKKFSKRVQKNINLWVRMYQGDRDALIALSIQHGFGTAEDFSEP